MQIKINFNSRIAGKLAICLFVIYCIIWNPVNAQRDSGTNSYSDSTVSSAHKAFNNVNKLHRTFFGENYRKEWSVETRFPSIHISQIHGGLRPLSQGGGNQTLSLRLVDKDGLEWVLRSIEKYPDAVLPENLRNTFVKDIVIDAMSAQHPYSALVVPPIAEALGVPHAHPIIGIVAPDSSLGAFSKIFEGRICLLEEREPGGKSDSYLRLQEMLDADNDNSFDSTTFLKARILDVFLGDWDRHPDQWRFRPEKYGDGIRYTSVPRDRDQVFYTNQGIFPYIESRPYVQPFFEGFNPKIRNVGTMLFTSTMMNIRLINQFSYAQWMKITYDCQASLTDSVLETALRQLPQTSYELRHIELLKIMKARRADLPKAMANYYFLLNKHVFIQTSNKNEMIEIVEAPNDSMRIDIFKLSEKGLIKQTLFSKTYSPELTKEIRFFIGKGNDSILINNSHSAIKLRFSGGGGEKKYNLITSKNKIQVYEKPEGIHLFGDTSRIRIHLSSDSMNTRIVPGILFNAFTPLVNAGYNPDDGIILGFTGRFTRGIDYTTAAYNTNRFKSYQQFGFMHSFATSAFSAKYDGEWTHLIGRADLKISATIYAPNNTHNFYGTGNESVFLKSGDYKIYYRSRFDLFTLTPTLKWTNKKRSSLSVGPSLQYYSYDSLQNVGRFISTPGAVLTYDSNTLIKTKLQAGLVFEYDLNRRDNDLLPTSGYRLHAGLMGYTGLNSNSKTYGQLLAHMVFYKSIGSSEALVLADRIGGGAIIGNPAFYQSVFLGGQGNLLGYRQFRFAGQYMAYNDFEVRLRVAEFANYILPGQLGLIGLFDIGRVWQKEDYSHQWHNGQGIGIYFAPAQVALIQFLMSYSIEGWYPVFTLGFRF
jgi:Omp85 superfamily domain